MSRAVHGGSCLRLRRSEEAVALVEKLLESSRAC